MALSDLTVFQETIRTAAVEVLAEQVDLFNAASAGTIVLGTEEHPGDFFDSISFAMINGLVKRRNPRASNTIATKAITNVTDTMVKVATGTYPVDLSPGQFKWIQQNPEEAGAAFGQSIAVQTMQDMLDQAITALCAAMSNVGAPVTWDMGGTFANPKPISFIGMTQAVGLFGDRAQNIRAWIMSSVAATSLYVNQLTNNERLFQWNDILVLRDPFGRIIFVTDNPSLKLQAQNNTTSTPAIYATLGLTEEAAYVLQQNDFTDNYDTRNGNENIQRTYQSEWSNMLGLKGFTWDKQNGGAAPNNAAIAVGTNWDMYVQQIKNTAGVLLKSNS